MWNPSPAYLAVLREYGLTEAQVAALLKNDARAGCGEAVGRSNAPAATQPVQTDQKPPAPPVEAQAMPTHGRAGQAWPVERGILAKMDRDPLADFRRAG